MKILVFNWEFITKHDLYQNFAKQKIEFELFTSRFSPRVGGQRKEFRESLAKALEGKVYDALFSINFFEDIATAANERDILYICWTYDSPALVEYKLNKYHIFS